MGMTDKDLAALRQLLEPLDQVAPGLGAASYQYVVDGRPAQALGELAQCLSRHRPRPLPDLGGSRYSTVLLSLQGWDAALSRRLGEVLAALLAEEGYRWPHHAVKGSCTHLDFFRALACVTESQMPGTALQHHPAAWLLNGPRCLELLQLAGAGAGELVEILFTPFTRGGQRRRTLQRLLPMKGLPAVLMAKPQDTVSGAQRLRGIELRRCIEQLDLWGLTSDPCIRGFLVTAVSAGGPAASAALTALLHAPDARRLLEPLLPAASPELRQQLEAVISHLPARQSAPSVAAPGEGPREDSGYVAIGGAWVLIPPAAPLPADTPLPAGIEAALRAAVSEAGQACAEIVRRGAHEPLPQGISFHEEPIGAFMDVLEGRPPARDGAAGLLGGAHPPGPFWGVIERYRRRLRELLTRPGVTVHHWARLNAIDPGTPQARRSTLLGVAPGPVPLELLRQAGLAAGDFRPILLACASHGMGATDILRGILNALDPVWPTSARPPLWQVIAENFELIDSALDLVPGKKPLLWETQRALELLALLPATPERYRDRLLHWAIHGGRKSATVALPPLLEAMPGIQAYLLSLLASGSQGARRTATRWLRERGDRRAVGALRKALARERSERGRIALLEALAGLGEDICPELRAPGLFAAALKESQELDADAALGPFSFPWEQLPALTWVDGQAVAPVLGRAWVAQAASLRVPTGYPLLHLVLDHLEAGCAQALGLLALKTFVSYDILRSSAAEARRYAEEHADEHMKRLKLRGIAAIRELAVAELCRRQQRRNPADTALEHRGLLALTRRAPPAEAAPIVQAYLQDHGHRHAQKALLLSALTQQPAAPVLQLLQEVASRYRQHPLRRHAQLLLAELAAARGTTLEELEDHLVPTAGLDERGELTLETARGPVTATIGPGLLPVLSDGRRRIVRSLTCAGDTARQALKHLRRELPLIVKEQSARLQQALIAGRVWPTEEIQARLFRHPVAGRLCELLIFAGLDAQDRIGVTFRPQFQPALQPLKDGSCINVAGEPVDISGCAGIRLAHAGLLEEREARAWRQHIEDFSIVPLFNQLF